ncbi:hypothetical protein [Streptomyces sp. NPDC058424]|uniref:hypothetical protein n=1 Tax=Streptomyces sp. NPDC058424 TaxID=3346491 RepID=UPI003668928D
MTSAPSSSRDGGEWPRTQASSRGREVEVEHLHVHLPRVFKASGSTRTANPEQEAAR